VEKTWVVLAPLASDPTIDTIVRHLSAIQEANEALKDELRAAQKSEKHLQKQIDEMTVQEEGQGVHHGGSRSLDACSPVTMNVF
jgi:hypothetical protein